MIIGIIGAMEVELQALTSEMKLKATEKISKIKFLSGEIAGREVVVACSGIGKVHAAICAEAMILKYSPGIIINVGVAGGIGHGVCAFDLVVADGAIQHDFDTSPVGDPPCLVAGMNEVVLPVCPELCEKLVKYAGVPVHKGKIVSGDQFLTDKQRIDELVSDYGALACDMESGAIAQVCHINGVRFASVRAISDTADESAGEDFASNVKRAADATASAVMSVIHMI